MRSAARALSILVGLTGAIQIVLGIVFWTGGGDGLIPVHILVGIILVLALWTLAGIAARAGVSRGMVSLTAVWGLIVLVLGITQKGLLPGNTHWIIQILHLLVGLAAIGLAQILAARIRQVDPSQSGRETSGMAL